MRCALLALLVVVATALLGGCSGTSGGGGEASCAAVVVVDGARYLGYGDLQRDPATTGREVDAVLPACNDTGSNGVMADEPDEAIRVEELTDVPVGTAVLWNGDLYLREGRDLPPVAQRWFASESAPAR